MRSYLTYPPKALADGVRLVHNFYPGPDHDPGRHRRSGDDGFRYWITDEPPPPKERRCYCGWLDGCEHYGTLKVIDAPRS
jgi:hypothetical protein